MAAREHRVSRRVLLGAACALPLTRHPGLDPGPSLFSSEPVSWIPDQVRDDEKWERNLAAFRRAQAVIDAAVSEPDQRRYDALLDTFTTTLRRLLRTPAPELPALALKIELAIDQVAWESTGGEACMAALKRDARRLAALQRV
jgi:hypothetical protein